MKLANGFKWSHRRQFLSAYLNGQLLYRMSGKKVVDSEQQRGLFRHRVMENLVSLGIDHKTSIKLAMYSAVRGNPPWLGPRQDQMDQLITSISEFTKCEAGVSSDYLVKFFQAHLVNELVSNLPTSN